MFNEFTTNHINKNYLDTLYVLSWAVSINATVIFRRVENDSKWPNTRKEKMFLLKFINYTIIASFFLTIWISKETSIQNVDVFFLQLNSLIFGILILITLIKFLHIYEECKKSSNFEKVILFRFNTTKSKFYFNWITIILILIVFLIAHFLLLWLGKF